MKFRKETEFQETEIGKIPRDWRIVRLKDVAMEIKSGFASGKRDEVDGIIHLRMFNIDLDGMLSFDEIIRVPKPKDWKQYLLRHGDILLVNTSGSEEHIGKVAIFENVELECTYSNHLTRIRIDENKADSRWVYFVLYYLLQTGYFKSLVHQQAGGQRNIPLKAIENLSITLPPVSEARKIAEFLSMFNTTIKLYREEMTKLERLKRGLMGELLTGRIRVREENGRLSFYRETELQETEIGEIPRDWKVVKLRAISTFAKRGKTPKYGNSELLVIKTAHNYPDRIRFEEAPRASEEFQAKLPKEFYLRPEDILVNSTGTGSVGRVGFFKGYHKPCTVDGHITILRTNQSMAIPKYVFYYLASHYGQSALLSKASGSTHQVELYVNEILDLTLPLPSLEEQREIAEVLSMIDQVIELHSEGITKLERLKRGLMDLLLTGKVRVVDSDVGS